MPTSSQVNTGGETSADETAAATTSNAEEAPAATFENTVTGTLGNGSQESIVSSTEDVQQSSASSSGASSNTRSYWCHRCQVNNPFH